MNTHISYETAKRLKEFLGDKAPEPIDGAKYCSGCEHISTETIKPPALACCPDSSYTVPAYQLHDLLSKPFCEEMAKATGQEVMRYECFEILGKAYFYNGLPAVEWELLRMMEGK